jgi:glycosyltransferase involved in cell wall biosynthesis
MSSAAAARAVSGAAALPAAVPAGERARLAVIVPTYRRPADLERCLRAIARQTRAPDQLIIVVRAEDAAAHAVLGKAELADLAPRIVTVLVSGVVAALNAGLAAADADIIAFTDDDAAPRPEWLRQIEAGFAADPGLGGLGGRDWVYQHGHLEDASEPTVGRITWFGRCIGNHHLGVGPAREVDALKGVNMSFRSRALAGVQFDTRLRGSGAQVCNELGVALAVKRGGWRLRYDPQIAVDHYPSVRHDEDRRNTFSAEALYNATFNETLLLCEHFPYWRRLAYLLVSLGVGQRVTPGLLQWVRLLPSEGPMATTRLRIAWAARLAGWRSAG